MYDLLMIKPTNGPVAFVEPKTVVSVEDVILQRVILVTMSPDSKIVPGLVQGSELELLLDEERFRVLDTLSPHISNLSDILFELDGSTLSIRVSLTDGDVTTTIKI